MVPTIYYFFWVKYHPNKVYSQKKSRQETKYRPHFPPTTKPHPLNPLDRGRLVLFRFAACFVLFLHKFPAMFIIFLWFGFSFLFFTWFLLLTLPVVPCFFLSCFFISIFKPILLYKRIWAFVDQIMLIGSKGSWVQFVFVCRSHFAKELYYAADLYSATDLFPLHFFLWTFLALRSS